MEALPTANQHISCLAAGMVTRLRPPLPREDEEGIGAVGAWRVTGFNKTYENNGKTHDHSKTMQDHLKNSGQRWPELDVRSKLGESLVYVRLSL